MSFTIRNVLDLEIMKNARLLAGEAKIDNPILWVNVMEIMDSFDALGKDEMLVTTGFGLDNYEKHSDTIRLLSERGLACLAVQPGYYIDAVPDFIIEEARRYNLPLIDLPKRLTFSSLTKAVLKNILIEASPPLYTAPRESDYLSAALKRNFLSGTEEQNILKALKHQADRTFFFILLSFFEKDLGILDSDDARASLKSILQDLKYTTGATGITCAINQYHGVLISVNAEIKSCDMEDILNDTATKKCELGESVLMHGGVSRNFSSPGDMFHAFLEAESALRQLQRSNVKKGFLCFANIELFKYVCGQYAENAIQYLNHTLSPVYDYDRLHKTDLMKTLRIFFRFNMNYQLTSKYLFIHRHTTKYRLDKIEELLGESLASGSVQFQLLLALYLDKYQA
ncbi:MAG: PucR family transcriptional regulator [Anaerovoracaceae bacterium]